MNDENRLLIITEQLFAAKKFVAILSFANSVFSLYALLQSFIAKYYALSLVCALVFLFNALMFSYTMRDWRRK